MKSIHYDKNMLIIAYLKKITVALITMVNCQKLTNCFLPVCTDTT